MQLAPGKLQFLRRLINQLGNLAIDLSDVRISRPVGPGSASTGNRRRLARVLASRNVGDWRFHTLAGSAMR